MLENQSELSIIWVSDQHLCCFQLCFSSNRYLLDLFHCVVMLFNCSLFNFNWKNIVCQIIPVLSISLQVVILTFDKIDPGWNSLSSIIKVSVVISIVSIRINIKKFNGICYNVWCLTYLKNAIIITSHVESVFSCHLSNKPPFELLYGKIIVSCFLDSVSFYVCVKFLINWWVFSFILICFVPDLIKISWFFSSNWVNSPCEVPEFSSDTILSNQWNINLWNSCFGSNCAIEFTITELGDSACNSINLHIDILVVETKSFDLHALPSSQVSWFLTDVKNYGNGLCFVAGWVVRKTSFHVGIMFNSITGFPKHFDITIKANWLVTNNTSDWVSLPSPECWFSINIVFKINESITNFCVDERHLITGQVINHVMNGFGIKVDCCCHIIVDYLWAYMMQHWSVVSSELNHASTQALTMSPSWFWR